MDGAAALRFPVSSHALAPNKAVPHIDRMSAKPASTSTKTHRNDGAVLGRSAATGQFVLKPASKMGAISLRQAKTAVASVQNSKKK
jgi:hypothetical protein